LIKINTQNNVNKIDTSLISKTKFIESILTSVIVKLDKYIKLIDAILCIKILLAGEEILLASDKIPIINMKKPNIVNKIKLLKNNTEEIKIKIPPHNGGDLGKFLVNCLCLE
tara:strand:- start:122 stop:457 length:336 start_codon:yes stop_codon:yes gene_type:complete